METKLVNIKTAAKIFNFPQKKLYDMVKEKEVPFVELTNLTGSTKTKINTRVFAEWLDDLARSKKTI